MTGEQHQYLIEMTRVGAQVKVVACDPNSGAEAVVIVPASTSRKDMTTLAIRKLQYVMGRNHISSE